MFEDPPEMAEVRAQFGQAHLDFLDKNSKEILLAGGLRDVPGGPFNGGLWVLEVPSRERVEELLKSDPNFIHSKRKYIIRFWGKAFEDRQVIL
jgi:uncharacterized protein YciI